MRKIVLIWRHQLLTYKEWRLQNSIFKFNDNSLHIQVKEWRFPNSIFKFN